MFDDSFMLLALISGIITGGLCAYLGNFILLRKMTFIGIALSEVAAFGIALGFILNISPGIVSFIVTLGAIVFFWQRSKNMLVPHDSMIGVIYAVSAALGIILISKNPLMESIGVDLISGNLLYCTKKDIINISLVLILILTSHLMFFKEFIFISFDRETAQAQGLKTGLLDFILMTSIGLCISMCMKLTGVLFVFSSMIIPVLTSLKLFKKVKFIFIFSVIFACISVFIGISISYYYDLPASPSIIFIYAVFYIISQLITFLFNK